MPWVKLDDSFFSHPKVLAAGMEAVGLFVCSLAYSSHHLTDGTVPVAWVKQAVGRRSAVLSARLVEQGLWEANGTGWVIHDYLTYQPSRERVLAKRAADSTRKGRGN